jgi:hypothetical protein
MGKQHESQSPRRYANKRIAKMRYEHAPTAGIICDNGARKGIIEPQNTSQKAATHIRGWSFRIGREYPSVGYVRHAGDHYFPVERCGAYLAGST